MLEYRRSALYRNIDAYATDICITRLMMNPPVQLWGFVLRHMLVMSICIYAIAIASPLCSQKWLNVMVSIERSHLYGLGRV